MENFPMSSFWVTYEKLTENKEVLWSLALDSSLGMVEMALAHHVQLWLLSLFLAVLWITSSLSRWEQDTRVN